MTSEHATRDEIIAQLRTENAELRATIASLRERLADVRADTEKLTASAKAFRALLTPNATEKL